MARAFLAFAVLLVSVSAADAQYFGRNKVQYDRFDFQILQTEHFDVYYYAEEGDAARIAARLAERWYRRLSASLDHRLRRRQPLILYASPSHFAQTAIIPGAIGEGVGGFTDHLAGRVVLPFAAGLGETDHVLGHEIVHAFQRDILKSRGRSLASLPLWFAEGMAEALSLGTLDANTSMWIRDAASSGHVPTLDELGNPRWFPYRYGQAVWRYLMATYGEEVVTRALRSRARNTVRRLQDATGASAATLEAEWQAFARSASAVDGARGFDDAAQRLIGGTEDAGSLNIGPRLSPDGRFVVFLSERDGYSIDIFVADAATGRVLKKLLSTAASPHLDSLQFIESAGAWSPAGDRFVIATVQDGRAALTFFDMPSGDVRREIRIPTVDHIYGPSWSPDGRRIAFSALHGGVTDLFTLDLESEAVDALTDDAYSDVQPSWSPDGSRLAFSTDRFSSDLATLRFGDYEIALFDVASRTVRRAAALPHAKAIDPHWVDGGTLLFVSDAGGVSNVFRAHLDDGAIDRITSVATGVSGITALSPSLSVIPGSDRFAASIYEHGSYAIWTVPLPAADAGEPLPLPAATLTRTAASPPPAAASAPVSASAAAAAPALPGLPSAAGRLAVKDYVPRLSIAQLGSPYLSAGGGAFGSFLRAGMSVGFSDILGQHALNAAVQVGKQSTDNAFELAYLNRRSRLNWGIGGGRIPALAGVSDVLAPSASGGTLVRTRDVVEQVHRQLSVTAAYPFSRARRLEVTFGADAMSIRRQTTVTEYSAATRAQLGDPVVATHAAHGALTMQAGTALVYDTAVFGATAPVLGQRYRLSFSLSFHDLDYFTAAADYRRYFMPIRPFTLAVRVQSVSRWGADATDGRLLPLVWSLSDLVRGFDTDADVARTHRFALGNVELRAPLLGARSRLLPLDALAFVDCGRFWFPDVRRDGAGSRDACSAGAGVRLNAAGFVFEFHGATPIAGTSTEGWRFGALFRPGF